MSVFLTAKLLKVICSDKDYADLYNLLAPKTYEMAYKRGFVSETNMIPCVPQSCSVNLYEKIFKLLLHLIEGEAYWAVTKGGTGTWDWDVGLGRGTGTWDWDVGLEQDKYNNKTNTINQK